MDKFNSSERVMALDGLRGMAVLFVIIHHFFTGITSPPDNIILHLLWNIGKVFFLSGVDLFYVLSGFLVGGIIIDHHKSPNFLKVFFIRRACRILPLYYLLILSYVLIPPLMDSANLLGSWAYEWLLERPLPIWSYLTFLQSYLMGLENHSGSKWIAITWSISVEEQFYIISSFLFMLLGYKRTIYIILLGILLAPLLRLCFFSNIGFYAGYMFFPGRMDTILWGVLLALIIRHPPLMEISNQKTSWILVISLFSFIILVLSSINIVHLPQVSKFTALAIMYFGLIFIIVENKLPLFNKLLEIKFLTYTGLISYAAYLSHQAINGLVHGLFFSAKPTLDSPPQFFASLFSVVIVYVICAFSYKYFEKPILKLGRKEQYISMR